MSYTDQTKMPWGKHKGKPLSKLPPKYMWWLLTGSQTKELDPGLYEYFYERAAEIKQRLKL